MPGAFAQREGSNKVKKAKEPIEVIKWACGQCFEEYNVYETASDCCDPALKTPKKPKKVRVGVKKNDD